MNGRKKLVISLIIGLIILLGGSFIALDWSRYFADEPILNEYIYSSTAKLLVTLLCTIITWMAGADAFNSKDGKKMRLVFIVIFIADMLFFLKWKMAGIAVFGLAQSLLAYRNGAGMSKLFTSDWFSTNKKALVFISLLVAIPVPLLLSLLFFPLLKASLMFYLFIGYSLLISISLWVALINPRMKIFPGTNSILVAAGMVLFYLCDINVGLTIALKPGIFWLFANSIIWIFIHLP